jgi:TonB dependent receptor
LLRLTEGSVGFQRMFQSPIRSDHVSEASAGIYAENTLYWTDWLRTTLGWRGDYYDGKVNSIFDANNSGHTKAAIGSPKFRMVLGPFYKTELFFGAGMGFHSNDARGATITESPVDRIADPGATSSPLTASPLLVRTRGFEAGHSYQDHSRPRFVGQRFRARSGVRNPVQRRRRRH